MKRAIRSKPGTVTVGNVIVRIYRRNRPTASGKCRTVFEVADYTSGVRRLRGFTDAAEAKREAEKIARQLATGESTAATMRNTEAASFGRAIELLRPSGASLEVGLLQPTPSALKSSAGMRTLTLRGRTPPATSKRRPNPFLT